MLDRRCSACEHWDMKQHVTIDDIRGQATINLWPDAAAILGIGRNAAYDAVADGTIPALRFGRTIRVPVPKLLAMIEATEPPQPKSAPQGDGFNSLDSGVLALRGLDDLTKRLGHLAKRLSTLEERMGDLRRPATDDDVQRWVDRTLSEPAVDYVGFSHVLLEDLNLTVRTYYCLHREGVRTLLDLTRKTEADLLDLRNFNAKSVDEVKANLAEYGLSLAG